VVIAGRIKFFFCWDEVQRKIKNTNTIMFMRERERERESKGRRSNGDRRKEALNIEKTCDILKWSF